MARAAPFGHAHGSQSEHGEQRTFTRVYFDRVVASLTILSGLGAAGLGARKPGAVIFGLGAAMMGASWANGHNRHGGTVPERLAESATAVAAATGAKLVVFGHTHREALTEGYANTGSFAFPGKAPGRPYLTIEGSPEHPRRSATTGREPAAPGSSAREPVARSVNVSGAVEQSSRGRAGLLLDGAPIQVERKGAIMQIFTTHRAAIALFSSLAVLAGCSGDGVSTGVPAEEITYARDIKPLVDAKCANCHVEGGIAPFALETYEDVSSMKGAVAAAVSARTMPPWQAAEGCTDYRGDRSLTDEQIDLLTRWVDAGAPEGDPSDTPIPVADERLSLSRVDLELPIPEPYTPQTFPDDYRCFLIDWPATDTTYVTGFGAAPDNQAIVHHLITFVARPASVATYQALDDADPGPGWTCYGGPGGDGSGPKVGWLGAWAPGGTGQDFPEGTGVEIPAGSKLVVQMHYNSLSHSPSPDRTKILVRTDASVTKKAAVMPVIDPKWLAGGMPIPAHSNDVMHSATMDPTEIVNLATGGALSGGKPLTVYAAGPHMHTLGKRITSRIEHAGGTNECMMDIPRWNFHWQLQYNFATPKQVAPGDKLYLECQWDNPGDTDVNWGEGTSDEMCLGVYYITE